VRPLLFSIPSVVVGLAAAPLVALYFLRSGLPRNWRLFGAGAGVVAVGIATAWYWKESVPVHAYGVMLAVAALVAVSIGAARAREAGFQEAEVVDFGIYVVLWGIVGARIFHVVERHDIYFSGKGLRGIWEALAVWNGGLVFYGGLIGAICYAAWYALRKKEGPRALVRMLDLAAPCVMFGLAFGRIGCFLNGCCFGRPCSLPWGVAYPRESHLWRAVHEAGSKASAWKDLLGGEGVPAGLAPATFHVHPTQLYESVIALAIGCILSWVFYRKPRAGVVSCLFLLSYPAARFVQEGWFRGDTPAAFPSVSGWLTISQYVSIVAFAVGLAWLAALLLKARAERTAAPEQR